MKTTYRPKVRNGHISRRPVKGTFAARAGWMPRNRHPHSVWILVIIGALVAGGFVAGLHWQIKAHNTSREEVRLKSALSQAESEQRFLQAEQVGALAPREIERATSRSRTAIQPVSLDAPEALRIPYQMAAQQARVRERDRERKEAIARMAKENRQAAAPNTVTVMPPQ